MDLFQASLFGEPVSAESTRKAVENMVEKAFASPLASAAPAIAFTQTGKKGKRKSVSSAPKSNPLNIKIPPENYPLVIYYARAKVDISVEQRIQLKALAEEWNAKEENKDNQMNELDALAYFFLGKQWGEFRAWKRVAWDFELPEEVKQKLLKEAEEKEKAEARAKESEATPLLGLIPEEKQRTGEEQKEEEQKIDASEIVIELRPFVTNGVKGNIDPIYWQVVASFPTLDSFLKNNKYPIGLIPGSDGHIYEVRKNEIGYFARTLGKITNDLNEGFVFQLPKKVPLQILENVLELFKAACPNEAFVYLCWNPDSESYYLQVPKQEASESRVIFDRTEIVRDNRVVVMEIHSHGEGLAYFSSQDDMDDIKTGLYGVMGQVNTEAPSFAIRASCNGHFFPVPVYQIFEAGGGQK